MLKKSKFLCGIVIGAMMLASFVGCGSQSSGNKNIFSYESDSEEAPVSQNVMARVESIDGSKVTLSVMGGRGGRMPEGGEMPEGGRMPEGGEMPEGRRMPEGGEMPEGRRIPEDGEMPEGGRMPEDGEMPERETEMGEPPMDRENRGEKKTAVLTIGDESVIMVDNDTEGSLSDIKEESMLMITFDENGDITGIHVFEGMKRPEK